MFTLYSILLSTIDRSKEIDGSFVMVNYDIRSKLEEVITREIDREVLWLGAIGLDYILYKLYLSSPTSLEIIRSCQDIINELRRNLEEEKDKTNEIYNRLRYKMELPFAS